MTIMTLTVPVDGDRFEVCTHGGPNSFRAYTQDGHVLGDVHLDTGATSSVDTRLGKILAYLNEWYRPVQKV